MIQNVLSGLDGDTIWAIEPNAYAALLARARDATLSSVSIDRAAAVPLETTIRRMTCGPDGCVLDLTDDTDAVSGVSAVSGATSGGGSGGGVVGVIELSGVMVKRPSRFSALFNDTSTELMRRAVESATQDADIGAILIRIDSPGGSVGGLAELADALFAARQVKPVVAQVTGMAASAALLVASQADQIFAQRMDQIGSIGTRMTVMDTSRFFANLGIEMIEINTGEFKSAGAPGTVVTDRQKEKFQEMVNAFFDDFVGSIVRGRSAMTDKRVRELADGGLFMASEAVRVGLIDGVQTFEQTLNQLIQRTRSVTNNHAANNPGRSGGPRARPAFNQPQEPTIMSDPINHTPAPGTAPGSPAPVSTPGTTANAPAVPVADANEPATFHQIKAACPGADAMFICDQLNAGATIDQARTGWMNTQQARLEARDQDLAKIKQASKRPGVDALVERGGGSSASNDHGDDPESAFQAAVKAKVDAGMDKAQATSAVVREDPDLHAAYLESYNHRNTPVHEQRKKMITQQVMI